MTLVLPDMVRVVIGVDPSGTAGPDPSDRDQDTGNDVGIVAAGLGVDGFGYVLGDWTCNLSPDGWGRRVVECYRRFNADRIVAEKNFGGAMVELVIRSVDKNVSMKLVNSTRGKVVRAQPVAALYEQNRIKHAAYMPELEDELVCFTDDGYVGGASPNRADALVFAITELMLKKSFSGAVGDVSKSLPLAVEATNGTTR
jgi:phage terminase large subunit-like protein